MSVAIGGSVSSSQRLPVNHRRRKVAPENRKRVSRACNSCNVRRIKCSGDQPCTQCRNPPRDCQYPLPDDKVSILRAEYEDLRNKCAFLEQCLEDAVTEKNQRAELQHRVRTQRVAQDVDNDFRESQSTEYKQIPDDGRVLQDPDGTMRYLGESSGAAFLDHPVISTRTRSLPACVAFD
jgi:Fungal Zn(2)-Cys(6) binuclear cluster domain